MHERLSARSKDYLAELKREYISGATHHGQDSKLKFRTMQSFELSINRILSGALSKDVLSTVMEVANLTQAPQALVELWQIVACIANGGNGRMKQLKASVEFLESKFAEEVTGLTDRVSRQLDKKTALYAYCRQRITVRTGDNSWIWFAVFCAFRAGWSSVLSEIAIEKSQQIEGLELVCSLLAKVVENIPIGTERDPTKLNSIMVADKSSEASAYRWLCVMICKNELDKIKISQDLPDCNAFDWIWFGLRSVLASSDETKLDELRAKIDALPVNYFDQHSNTSGLYPLLSESLGFSGNGTSAPARSVASSKSAIQLGIMQFLALDFEKGIRTALKNPDEAFDINDPFHRAALFISVCLDKFGCLDGSQIVLEAALSVAVVQERNTYASAVSSASGKKVIDQLARLDSRRDRSVNQPALKGQ